MLIKHKYLPSLPPLFLLAAIFLSMVTMAQDVLKIGAIYSLTGPAAGTAKLQKMVTELAVRDINQAGGINVGGKKVKLEVIFGDDQSKAATAVALFEDMVKKHGVSAIICGKWVHDVLAMNSAAKESPAFFIVTCAVPDAVHQRDVRAPTDLSILGGISDVGRTGDSYLADKMKPKKVESLMASFEFGNAVVSGLEAGIKRYPEIKNDALEYPIGSSDIKRNEQVVRGFKPEIIMTGSRRQAQIAATDEAPKMSLAREAKLSHSWLADVSATAAPTHTTQAVAAKMFWDDHVIDFNNEAVVKASNEFGAKFGMAYSDVTEACAMCAYSAVREIARAIEAAEGTELLKKQQALLAIRIWTGCKR